VEAGLAETPPSASFPREGPGAARWAPLFRLSRVRSDALEALVDEVRVDLGCLEPLVAEEALDLY
jgi:hypothetical protein